MNQNNLNGSNEYVSPGITASINSGSAEFITSSNIADIHYSGNDRSPSLSPTTIRLNNIAAPKRARIRNNTVLSNSYFYPQQYIVMSEPTSVTPNSMYPSATPLEQYNSNRAPA